MWSDKESDKDYLNFGEVAQIASEIINSPDMLPVSIGIFGSWGAGKSSVLELIEKELLQENYIIIKFDAWLYQGYDDARMALMEKIALKLNEEASKNTGLLEKTKKLLSRVDVMRFLGLAAEGIALVNGIPTGGLFYKGIQAFDRARAGSLSIEDYENGKNIVKDVKDTASSILKPSENRTPPKEIDAFRAEYGEILNGLGKTLVVVIDNLDRCIPKNAIQVLESIRLFLFLNKTAFIIAADEDMIRVSVKEYFPSSSEKHQIDYLDKLIQVPIRVPKAGIREIRSYLFMLYAINFRLDESKLEKLRKGLEENMCNSWKDEALTISDLLLLTGDAGNKKLEKSYEIAERIAPLLTTSPYIKGNPRIVKRLLNVIQMRSKIALQRKMDLLDEAIITKLVIFERCAGQEAAESLYQMINMESGKPMILKMLEENFEEFSKKLPESWNQRVDFIKEWVKIEPSLKEVDLRGAVYLSRETATISIQTAELSIRAKELLKALVNAENTSSPTIKTALESLNSEDEIPVMEKIIVHLRQTSDWSKRPLGFSGACILAQHSLQASKLLDSFIREINKEGKKPLWLKTALKNKSWYTGE